MRNHSIHTRIFRAACALMSVCMLLACVPTPETEFVVNKGEQKEMLDLAKVEIASNVVSDSQGTANRIDYETLFGIRRRDGPLPTNGDYHYWLRPVRGRSRTANYQEGTLVPDV